MQTKFTLLAFIFVFLFAPHCQAWGTAKDPKIVGAIGSVDLNFCLVTKDSDDRYRLLSKRDFLSPSCQLLALEADRALVSGWGGSKRVIELPSPQVPADIFLMALATVYQRTIVVGARVDGLGPFEVELLTDPAKLCDFCRRHGLDIRVFDDCMVIRRGNFRGDERPFTHSSEQEACEANFVRVPIRNVIEYLAKADPTATPPNATSGDVSVKSYGGSAAALLYYLGMATRPRTE